MTADSREADLSTLLLQRPLSGRRDARLCDWDGRGADVRNGRVARMLPGGWLTRYPKEGNLLER
jgi:hypothetical protein